MRVTVHTYYDCYGVAFRVFDAVSVLCWVRYMNAKHGLTW